MTLQTIEFELLGNLNDEQDALESFYDYRGSTYICDAISEIGDNYIPIYNGDVWAHVSDIQEYIEEAVSNGLVDTSEFGLVNTFQCGYYQFYTASLYNNLEVLMYNHVANTVNEQFLDELEEEQLNELDIEDVEQRIKDALEDIDNNNMISDLEEVAETIIDELKEDLDEE
jgi:hypothetical protein